MKMTRFAVLTGAILLVAGLPSAALAQNTRAPSSGTATHKIGLIDIGYIFDHYERLKVHRENLQAEIKATAENPEITAIRKQIEGYQSQLESLTAGSQKAIQIEQKLISLNAQGQAKRATLKREFMRKEVAMYKDAYARITTAVRMYAVDQNYTLVLRYQRAPSSEEAAGANPRQMMQQVNQLVVYHQSGDDMTDIILRYLNSQYAKSQGQTASTADPRTRN